MAGLTVNIVKPASAASSSKLPVVVVRFPDYVNYLVSQDNNYTVDIWWSVAMNALRHAMFLNEAYRRF